MSSDTQAFDASVPCAGVALSAGDDALLIIAMSSRDAAALIAARARMHLQSIPARNGAGVLHGRVAPQMAHDLGILPLRETWVHHVPISHPARLLFAQLRRRTSPTSASPGASLDEAIHDVVGTDAPVAREAGVDPSILKVLCHAQHMTSTHLFTPAALRDELHTVDAWIARDPAEYVCFDRRGLRIAARRPAVEHDDAEASDDIGRSASRGPRSWRAMAPIVVSATIEDEYLAFLGLLTAPTLPDAQPFLTALASALVLPRALGHNLLSPGRLRHIVEQVLPAFVADHPDPAVPSALLEVLLTSAWPELRALALEHVGAWPSAGQPGRLG